MAALLAAEAGARDLHPLEDVLVADRRPDRPGRRPPRRPPAGRRSKDRDDERALGQDAAREPVEGEDARGPGRRRRPGPAASTAISRSASPSRANPTSAPRSRDRRGERRRRRRPGVDVDVDPVGLVVDDLDRGPGRARGSPARRRRRSRSRSRGRSAAPLAVDRRGRAPAGARGSARGGRGSTTDRPISAFADRAELLGPPDQLLELVLDVVVELEAVLVEDLEAVVVGRVVGRRDHDPGRERRRCRRGTRGPASGRSRRSWTSTPRLVAPAAIAATNMSPERRVSWPTTSAPPVPDEPVRGRPAEGVGEGRLEVDVGDAADPVGAEEAGHRYGAGDGAGAALATGVTVTVTVGGSTATRRQARRAGSPSSVTSCVPGPRPPTRGEQRERRPRRAGRGRRRARRRARALVDREVVVEPGLGRRTGRARRRRSAVPATGRIETVTVTWTSWPPSGWTPGRQREADRPGSTSGSRR